MLVSENLFWDPATKGQGIKLSNANLTLNKIGEVEDYQLVIGNISFSEGKHYWEIKIDKYLEEYDILIGVASKNIVLN